MRYGWVGVRVYQNNNKVNQSKNTAIFCFVYWYAPFALLLARTSSASPAPRLVSEAHITGVIGGALSHHAWEELPVVSPPTPPDFVAAHPVIRVSLLPTAASPSWPCLHDIKAGACGKGRRGVGHCRATAAASSTRYAASLAACGAGA